MRRPALVVVMITLALVCFTQTASYGATLYVGPGETYTTIQAALNAAANDGDEIIVRNGTYTGYGNKNLDFRGRAITLRSEYGPQNCIIDCEGDGRGFYFHSGETSGAVVDGFSIINGSVTGGGNNGGGILIDNSSPVINNCIISGNSSAWYGGGIASQTASPIVTKCIISGNSAVVGAGILLVGGGTPTVSSCTISENTATNHGGGIFCSVVNSSSIVNCIISENSAASIAGGIGTAGFISNATIINNCTITGNLAGWWGGGVYCEGSSTTIENCILWGDTCIEGAEIAISSGSLTVSYSDVEGGQAAAYGSLIWGDGNIQAIPLFAGGDNFHLAADSPCIDAGIDSGVYTDIDGDTRPLGDGFDMGADEFALISTLSQINLQLPANGDTLSAPPTFTWIVDAGENNAYAIDFALPPAFPFWSTHENMHQIIYDTAWTMPLWMWQRIPSGSRVYWRVRGADLNLTPLTPVTSDEVWSFYKQ